MYIYINRDPYLLDQAVAKRQWMDTLVRKTLKRLWKCLIWWKHTTLFLAMWIRLDGLCNHAEVALVKGFYMKMKRNGIAVGQITYTGTIDMANWNKRLRCLIKWPKMVVILILSHTPHYKMDFARWGVLKLLRR